MWSDLTNHNIISISHISSMTNGLACGLASAVGACTLSNWGRKEELAKLIEANNKVVEAKMEQSTKLIEAKMEQNNELIETKMEQNNKLIETKMEQNNKLIFEKLEKLDAKIAENNAMLLESIVKILKKN